MTSDRNRRDFLLALGAGAAALAIDPVGAIAFPPAGKLKPISGSWFEFQHHATVEGVDWNPACARFTAEQWDAKIKEAADIGMDNLVLMATALYYRAFFDTKIFAKWQLACANPLEAVLSAADKYNVKFFIGVGFYGDWQSDKTISDPVATKKRFQAIEELTNQYAHHPSFYGWYWPDEAEIHPYFTQEFIDYVNGCSRLVRQLTPHAPIMIAPYGTRTAVADDQYVRQLDAMDVDIFAYQDEVGVRKSKVTETSAFFATLRKAHDRSQKAKLWADMEIFEFQSEVYNSALMPGPFDRILRQMEAVSPWVDKILAYQYQGMMNKPGSVAFAGCPASAKLYSDYVSWLKGHRTVER
jgi:Domain of unknown function (DUF4434)